MPGTFTRFRIEGLHNARTVDVTIEDNKLVLVGDNGAGKSTLLNFVYSFLTQRWHRLMSYEFRDVQAEIDGKVLTIGKDDLRAACGSLGAAWLIQAKHNAPDWRQPLYTVPKSVSVDPGSEGYTLEYSTLHTLWDWAAHANAPDALTVPDSVRNAGEVLDAANLGEVLYLPTYRRIEQDLGSILPGQALATSQSRARNDRQTERDASVSLVRFGMEDVEANIQEVLGHLKDRARSSMTGLAWAFLRDLLSGDDQPFDLSVIQQIEGPALEIMFSRIDERALPVAQRYLLNNLGPGRAKTGRAGGVGRGEAAVAA